MTVNTLDPNLTAMRAACEAALPHAYAPYSNFKVAACLRGHNGKLYAACNTENAAYPLCSCAEANAIGMMVSDGEQRIDAIMVLTPTEKPTPPCGGCLQRLVEFASPTATVHMCTQDGHAEDHQPLSRLLPAAFNHDHLRTPHD